MNLTNNTNAGTDNQWGRWDADAATDLASSMQPPAFHTTRAGCTRHRPQETTGDAATTTDSLYGYGDGVHSPRSPTDAEINDRLRGQGVHSLSSPTDAATMDCLRVQGVTQHHHQQTQRLQPTCAGGHSPSPPTDVGTTDSLRVQGVTHHHHQQM